MKTAQPPVFPWGAPERRAAIDPRRLGPGGSSLAPYLALWSEARAGDMLGLLGRIHARDLDSHVLVLDCDRNGTFLYRFFGSALTFVDAKGRAALIGRTGEDFGDRETVLASRAGYVAAIEREAPVCEWVDRPRRDPHGRPVPRVPYRRLVLPVPVNRRTTRLIVASELVPPA